MTLLNILVEVLLYTMMNVVNITVKNKEVMKLKMNLNVGSIINIKVNSIIVYKYFLMNDFDNQIKSVNLICV